MCTTYLIQAKALESLRTDISASCPSALEPEDEPLSVSESESIGISNLCRLGVRVGGNVSSFCFLLMVDEAFTAETALALPDEVRCLRSRIGYDNAVNNRWLEG